ncbi:hypothetical protein GNF10_35775 [Nostoc sp. UCD121]|uniref:hypothetical protein n=1 Tax=unclassified Nostoc TaxID=2593658 RepID=UPI0016262C8E|nr:MULTISPECIES: hypothetical protein [unclassified Nostoc]MBC1218535.1 hypothetical protein [Nostoc sp. UCD120]MBC1281143.1 hypothetical protein [Nostoc sp. UCD121]MBC1297645.1 hypothetical protein [Nostoc sp. UCD122]
MKIFFKNLVGEIRKSSFYSQETYVVEIRFLDSSDFNLGHDYVGSFSDCLENAVASFKDLAEFTYDNDSAPF